MARLSEHHRAKCGVTGKCSVPMFGGYGPDGFCDNPAYGEQYDFGSGYEDPSWLRPGQWAEGGGRRRPYAPSLCCSAHGGPAEEQIRFIRDGNMWCAFLPGFVSLQESDAGFGKTQREAEADLRKRIAGEQQ